MIGKTYCHINSDNLLTIGKVIRIEKIGDNNFIVIQDNAGMDWLLTGVYFEYTILVQNILKIMDHRIRYEFFSTVQKK